MPEALIENFSARKIAEEYGTPTYIYSKTQIENNIQTLQRVFPSEKHLICYAAKANSNIHLLRIFADAGLGVDTVSGGEIYLALKAGILPNRIIFSGVGKTHAEILFAIQSQIKAIHVESLFELKNILKLALMLKASVSVGMRLNPSVDVKTHPKIATGHSESKFGIFAEEWIECQKLLLKYPQNIRLVGISCHIGSQIFSLKPFERLAKFLQKNVLNLRKTGFILDYIDCGGGVGVPYNGEKSIELKSYAKIFKNLAQELNLNLILEPGRLLVANAGTLLTSVIGVKATSNKQIVVLDAGMNDLLRPALYDAQHELTPVIARAGKKYTYNFVGPVCESADIFLRDYRFQKVQEKDLILMEKVGAYGFSMTSHYNSRPKVCEVLVDKNKIQCIRRRETYEDLVLPLDSGRHLNL